MGWSNATKQAVEAIFDRPSFTKAKIDWAHLVALDFETYWDTDYTLRKLSTSEYVRDPRFKAHMVGIKIGRRKTKVVPTSKIGAILRTIDWKTHDLLCHNTAFDGFILSHHFGVVPRTYYDTLSMARGLHSNDIGASLDEVAQYYGVGNKVPDVLEQTLGVVTLPKPLYTATAEYCAVDVDLCLLIFERMLDAYPANELKLIDMTVRMFCDPVLKVDIPRVEAELKREIEYREELMMNIVDVTQYPEKDLLKKPAERALTGKERHLLMVKRVIGSNEKFADLLRMEGIDPPMKISPAWMKKPKDERRDEDKWAYAFAKDDQEFIELPDDIESLGTGLNLNSKKDIEKLALRQDRVRSLVDCRLAVKSTTNITRAERFLKAGANGMSLPCGYAYYRAHTGRWGGNNKMNMQNLTRGGELRLSILAPKGYMVVVGDSGQIEARVNGWLWGQHDLMDAFRAADNKTGLDAYCNFATSIYGRRITPDDKMERFVGKVCVLGLGFQMGAAKLQITLAKGALGGPPVFFSLDRCKEIINTYRRKNHKIQSGWEICKGIIEDMAAGRTGSHGPINWEKERIWLPNGMCLKYPDLQKKLGDKGWDEWSYQSKDMRKKIYGGLLCENIVQALARIIVAEQMVVFGTKRRVVMVTHDEIVGIARVRAADKCYRELMDAMRTPLHWCADIPLNSEGGFDVRYSK
jgi:hypothetical protein